MLYSTEEKMEYVKLWQAHSVMFWSRLQTAALIHSGVLVGWYTLHKDHSILLEKGILILGVTMTICIELIMWRDTQYMDTMKRLADEMFPATGKALSGRFWGHAVVILPTIGELILLFSPCLKHALAVLFCGAFSN